MIREAPTPTLVHFQREHGLPVDDCWRCERERGKCLKKRRWADPVEASQASGQQNEDMGWRSPVIPYRCCWCSWWHVASARTAQQKRRMARQQRRAGRKAAA